MQHYIILEKTADIIEKQRAKGIGKLGMQKTVSEDDFEVEPEKASNLHVDLSKEHLDKMRKFEGVIADFKKKMEKLDPESKEYKHYHSVCAVNEVERERHRQHAASHQECHDKHTKLAKLYKKGIPSDDEIKQIVNAKSI